MTAELIIDAFEKMVSGIAKIVTPTKIPHLYHAFATTHEINSVYHFAKGVEQCSTPSAVYLEYQCDSGRVDAVIVTRASLLLVEAKSRLDFGRLGSLEDQAARLSNPEDSLRKNLADRIRPFKKEKWGVDRPDEIWGVLIAETLEPSWKERWIALRDNITYPTLRSYTSLAKENLVYQHWYHLLAYKRLA